MTQQGPEIRALYLDCDGVATLDPAGSESTFRYIYKAAGLADRRIITFEQLYANYTDADGKKRFMHPLERGEVVHADIWNAFCEKAEVRLDIKLLDPAFRSTPMNEPMLYVAQKVKDAGYVVGMITDNPGDRMEALVHEYDLLELFNLVVVSADPDVCTLKKEPGARQYDVAAERSGVAKENSLFIDNSSGNVNAAIAKGMPAILFDDSKLKDARLNRKEVARIEAELRRRGMEF